MKCSSCVNHIEGLFKQDSIVESISVNLEKKEAKCTTTDIDKVIETIKNANFEVHLIKFNE
jgi:copper chaperone CopZ